MIKKGIMMWNIFNMVYLTIVSLLFSTQQKEENKPVRLNKKEPNPKKKNPKLPNNINYWNILLIIGVIIILSVVTYIIFQTGSLESTNYYYKLTENI